MNPLLRALATNPALPPELIDRLTRTGCADVTDALAAREDLGHAQAVALAAHADETAAGLAHSGRLTAADIDPAAQPYAALALLDEGTGSPRWARLFAAHPVVEHRERLAACPGLPPDVVETLAADPDVRVVAELALWTTGDVAARLARHPHAEVRSAVAANEATPPNVLAALVTGEGLPPARRCAVCDREATPFLHDPHCARPDCVLRPGAACDGSHQSTAHEMYVRALANPATPAAAVVGFADHPSTLLRRQLAARTDLPRWVCGRLAGDPAPGVRAEVAANPVIGEALTRLLAADRDPEVRRGLAFNPRVPLDVLMSLAGAVRTGTTLLPRIAAASPAEVETLATAPDPAVRALLAERRDLPDDIRDALAADTDAKVVKSAARHPGLSGATLRAMLDRHGDQVVAGVAGNPDAPPPLLEDLALRQPPVRKALQEVARHRNASPAALLACLADRRARRVAAAHPALPPHVLVGLLADPDEEVAEAAAANPALPPAVMRQLVRSAAGG
ncbi:hypothetical protein [Streptomyces thermolilacinus]|uniref:Leucine rich repeat variant n=1 Tax=Streptomyces thermolilacinus SPC6 TaxID=1306406 RepID=A0A1D3DXF3_9ACTN|nr:hypothetical protein [Streptomyces thermolilacinus]OEJ97002.1 hypothetical protein J116_023685 [Streptomyces thermolilacinus SPC6]